MVVWQQPSESEWVRVPMAAVASIVSLPEPSPPRTPGPFAFAESDHVESVLERAGFVDVAIAEYRTGIHLGDDPVDAAHFVLSVNPAGPILDTMDRDMTASVVDAVERLFEERGSYELEGASWVVTARNH